MAITRCQLRVWLSWVGCNTILQQNIIYIILGGMPQQDLSTILLQFNLGDQWLCRLPHIQNLFHYYHLHILSPLSACLVDFCGLVEVQSFSFDSFHRTDCAPIIFVFYLKFPENYPLFSRNKTYSNMKTSLSLHFLQNLQNTAQLGLQIFLTPSLAQSLISNQSFRLKVSRI